ncbi:MAG: hypothetical protein ABGX16_24565 [Pirellulales bacterium]
MRYASGGAELYDMNNDPNQFTNLASNPSYATVLKQMDDALHIRLQDADLNLNKQQPDSIPRNER